MKLLLENVTLMWPQLFSKVPDYKNETKLVNKAEFLIDKNDPKIAAYDNLILKVIQEKLAKGVPTFIKTLKGTDSYVLKDGDLKEDEHYHGKFYLRAKTREPNAKVWVWGRDKRELTDSSASMFYSGCKVNAIVDLWYSSFESKPMVCSTLLGVQFVSDGVPVVNRTTVSADEFPDMPELAVDSDFSDIPGLENHDNFSDLT